MCHVATTHVVESSYGFACVVIPTTYSKFHRNPFWVSEPQGVEICPFPLLLLLAFTTACNTVQAVLARDHWYTVAHCFCISITSSEILYDIFLRYT